MANGDHTAPGVKSIVESAHHQHGLRAAAGLRRTPSAVKHQQVRRLRHELREPDLRAHVRVQRQGAAFDQEFGHSARRRGGAGSSKHLVIKRRSPSSRTKQQACSARWSPRVEGEDKRAQTGREPLAGLPIEVEAAGEGRERRRPAWAFFPSRIDGPWARKSSRIEGAGQRGPDAADVPVRRVPSVDQTQWNAASAAGSGQAAAAGSRNSPMVERYSHMPGPDSQRRRRPRPSSCRSAWSSQAVSVEFRSTRPDVASGWHRPPDPPRVFSKLSEETSPST